jgi:pimeloyl-ACP methyl ester carboxylesterase
VILLKILIKNKYINYEVSGFGSPIILLHGWGLNLHTFDNLAKQLNEDYTIYQLDLPGFGLSEIDEVLTIKDYADIINEFCCSLAIINPVVVGHSFGGRVALKYATCYPIDKLVLISSPGLKQRFNIIVWFKIMIYKISKRLNIKLKMGSSDYKKSSALMKNILVKAINTDQFEDAANVKCPTLLLYGKKDKSVPVYIGRKFNDLISQTTYFEIKRCGHFPYLERFRLTLIVLKSFLYGEKI